MLFITNNFTLKSNASTIRAYEHAKVWVKGGAEVTVITSALNFSASRFVSMMGTKMALRPYSK